MEDVFVTRPLLPSFDEYVEEIKTIWPAKWITNMGPKHNELSKQLQEYLDVPYVDLVVNGHSALELTLQALEITGEVITTPFTFVSTVHAIVRSGCKPVFCDILSSDYTIDPSLIESKITDQTSAILPVHVYGGVCHVEDIQHIASKYGLKVVYDSAHAFGVKYKGKSISQYGNASCFSFHATKVFNTIEGGAVCSNDASLHECICRLRDFGFDQNGDIVDVGTNAKMNEFSAAMGLCNLRHMSEVLTNRKKIYELYTDLLSEVAGISINVFRDEIEANYSYCPIVVDRDYYGHSSQELLKKLAEKHIFGREYFSPIICEANCYKEDYGGDYPIAKRISDSVLTLPIYADLDTDTVEYICTVIKNFANA